MEVKINREIRDYSESVYFGLTLRQFIFSLLACGVAVLIYFLLRSYFGIETLSWMCILAVAPFAAIGFVKYNGMNAEEVLINIIKSYLYFNKGLVYESNNLYYELINSKGDDKHKNDKKSV